MSVFRGILTGFGCIPLAFKLSNRLVGVVFTQNQLPGVACLAQEKIIICKYIDSGCISNKLVDIFDNIVKGCLEGEMPPKSKRSGKTAEEKVKVTPSRQSKRNVDKYVEYKEEEGSEDELPPARKRSPPKKPKESEESEFSDNEVDPEERKSKSKKKGGQSRKKKLPKSSGESGDDDVNSNSGDDAEEGDEETVKANTKIKSPPSKKQKVESTKLNRTDTDFESLDFSSDKTTSDGKPWNLKVACWNIGGLKSWIKKGCLEYIKHENPDILCLQETKCAESKVPSEAKVEGYHTYWLAGEKDGYAGVGLYSKEKPIDVKYGLGNKEFDTEGRMITAEYEKFYLVNAYVPNAGRGLVTLPKRMKWDPDLRNYLKELDEKKPVIVAGDMNVSHQEIDLANPKTNTKNAGFTKEEREGFSELLKAGFVDTFRHLYPDKTGAYTFWTYMKNARSKNVGWRLDYFLVSERLVSAVCDTVIRSEVYGSDHCPLVLLVHM